MRKDAADLGNDAILATISAEIARHKRVLIEAKPLAKQIEDLAEAVERKRKALVQADKAVADAKAKRAEVAQEYKAMNGELKDLRVQRAAVDQGDPLCEDDGYRSSWSDLEPQGDAGDDEMWITGWEDEGLPVPAPAAAPAGGPLPSDQAREEYIRKLQQAFLNFSGPLTDPPGTPAEGQQPETDGATDAKARFNAANLDAARTLAQTPT